MYEPRAYTTAELLDWCRFSALTLLGLALAYARERDGSVDGFVSFAASKLEASGGTLGAGGVEAAALGLALSVEALGAEVRSRSMTAEQADLTISDLPSERLCQDLEDRFEVQITPEEMLALAGVTREEMSRVYDILGAAAAAGGVEFQREAAEDDAGQRLTLRAW